MKKVCLLLALALLSCKPTPAPPKPLGEKLVAGQLSELRLLPGETHLRFLMDAKKPQPQETASSLRLGKLYLLHLKTRKLTRLGEQVSSLASTQHATDDGKYLLFLDAFNPSTKTGRLHCTNVEAATVGKALGEEVNFFISSAQTAQLAFVDGGVLKVGPLPQGPFLAIADKVAHAEFSKDGSMLAFKKRFEANEELWVADLKGTGKTPRLVKAHSGEYRLSKDGKKLFFTARKMPEDKALHLFVADLHEGAVPKVLSQEMFRFALSPDERWVAYLETKTPERPGTLWVRLATGAGEAKMLGERIREFEFASNSGALAWREALQGEEGTLSLVMLQGELTPRRLTSRTRHWQWNAQGNALAYTATVPTPDTSVSVDLFFFRLGDKAPTKVHAWVYEYAFSVDGESLFFEANCIREGISCTLWSIKLQEAEGGAKTKLAEGVLSFRPSEDGRHVYWLHRTPLPPVYTQLWATEIANPLPQKLAHHVHLPPPLPMDKTGRRFLYLSNQPQEEGLYLTELK